MKKSVVCLFNNFNINITIHYNLLLFNLNLPLFFIQISRQSCITLAVEVEPYVAAVVVAAADRIGIAALETVVVVS